MCHQSIHSGVAICHGGHSVPTNNGKQHHLWWNYFYANHLCIWQWTASWHITIASIFPVHKLCLEILALLLHWRYANQWWQSVWTSAGKGVLGWWLVTHLWLHCCLHCTGSCCCCWYADMGLLTAATHIISCQYHHHHCKSVHFGQLGCVDSHYCQTLHVHLYIILMTIVLLFPQPQ